ncbi:MAG: chromosome segregation protein SMC, partial [Planctomycetota bacterium]
QELEVCQEQIKVLSEKESSSDEAAQLQMSVNTELASKLADQTTKADAADQQRQQIQTDLSHAETELDSVVQRISDLNGELKVAQADLLVNEEQIQTITGFIESNDDMISESELRRSDLNQQATNAKVALAKSEQVLDSVQNRLANYQSEFEEQLELSQQLKNQKGQDQEALQSANASVEQAEKELKDLKERKNQEDDFLTELTEQRLKVDTQRRKLSTQLNSQRDELRTAEESLHKSSMRIEQLNLQRGQLAERLEEDYGIDISKLESVDSLTEQEIQERDKIDSEITDLRKQIGKIGSVNLDALQELEDLEGRYTSMDQQYQDLVQAKETLEKIIARIDSDSRKLFVETLEAIRNNFQKLFRQTFGGGKADILLEPDVDPLEAGVDIIATPPGKPEFNNSLLSGGEKALTAVSLLMAIFQFRPSPFCVLDEVDAPFDEANIGRFIDVLKSFLGWTKFVIVTHSKKTMTAATTLYGITMQESGVSKRVSVRFEDVSEDGQISNDAIQREDDAA